MPTPQTLLQDIALYRRFFERRNIEKLVLPDDEFCASKERGLGYCFRILDDVEEFAQQGRMEEAREWLRFIQGMLVGSGVCTLNGLNNHSATER